MIRKLQNPGEAEKIFGNWPETILWSCLSGTMGAIYAPEGKNPRSAMAVLGDFCFLAGRPDRELVLYKEAWKEKTFMILIPENESWESILADCHRGKIRKITRYATKKDTVFDKRRLEEALQSLPADYEIRKIDGEIFRRCFREEWSRDLVSQFPDYGVYEKLGIGYVVVHGKEIVCGASSYSRYPGGIEIEIDTKERWRRKGLAYVCGARLIMACLERGLYPSWDAHSKVSLALAEKLGYQFSHAYTAYEIMEV
ncbi:MAG: GNAT family N-acetyltransferase [Ruminococcus sp.]|jgi:GNAT superfamily N-acetyltransferase